MTASIQEVELLCSGSEFQLYLESCDPWLQDSGVARIRQCIRRARRLSLLWHAEINVARNRARRHTGRTRFHRSTGPVLARRKAELFNEIAQRFTSQLIALEEASRRSDGFVPAMANETAALAPHPGATSAAAPKAASRTPVPVRAKWITPKPAEASKPDQMGTVSQQAARRNS